MGSGYDFKCKKCKIEYSAIPGIGIMYPRVYQGAIEDIKNGKYGPEWQKIMNSEELLLSMLKEKSIFAVSASIGKQT